MTESERRAVRGRERDRDREREKEENLRTSGNVIPISIEAPL